MMNAKREELLSRMIRIYGFEHEQVIEFAKLLERTHIPDENLEILVECHEEYPVTDPWDDEEEDF